MIAKLKGQLEFLDEESVIIDVGGVGYDVRASQISLAALEGRRGEPLELWIHTHVREDALELFGFLTVGEKNFFLNLLKINGVGPRLAMNILSGARIEEIAQMIEQEDLKGLTKLPKVGKKIAEQMVLGLKGKLVRFEKDESVAGRRESRESLIDDAAGSAVLYLEDEKKQLLSALVNLGFDRHEALILLKEVPGGLAFEDSLRWCLAQVWQKGRKSLEL